MWVKINKSDKKSVPEKKSFVPFAAVLAALVMIGQVIIDITGLNKFEAVDKLTWTEVFYKIPTYLLISIGIFILLYLLQLGNIITLSPKENTYICDKCNKKKTDDKNYNCECGGEFIHINEMKWVEDEDIHDE